jgi:hypothetical protein
MAIVYHITSHGFGHAVRSAAVVNEIPPDVPVLVRTMVPRSILEQEIHRPFDLQEVRFDCGAVQLDALVVDQRATLETYAQIDAENQGRLAQEAAFLKHVGARLVVSDVASFPFRIAKTAGLPSVAIGNFTWAGIYEPYLFHEPEFAGLVDRLRAEYALADMCVRLPFAMSMKEFPRRINAPLVCRPVTPIRERLAREYGLDASLRWVQLYVGHGPSEFDMQRLGSIPGTVFLQLGTVAREGPAVQIDPRTFAGQDVASACDAVLAKPGYGIAADCVAGGTPLIYCSRDDFAEFFVLDEELRQWGLGVCIAPDEFLTGDLRPALQQAFAFPKRAPAAYEGAARVADYLVRCWRTGRVADSLTS